MVEATHWERAVRGERSLTMAVTQKYCWWIVVGFVWALVKHWESQVPLVSLQIQEVRGGFGMRRSDKPSLWFLSHDTLEKTWASRMCPTGKWERPCVPDSATTSVLLILLTSSAVEFELCWLLPLHPGYRRDAMIYRWLKNEQRIMKWTHTHRCYPLQASISCEVRQTYFNKNLFQASFSFKILTLFSCFFFFFCFVFPLSNASVNRQLSS